MQTSVAKTVETYYRLVDRVQAYLDAPEGSAEARDRLADVIETVDETEGGDEQ